MSDQSLSDISPSPLTYAKAAIQSETDRLIREAIASKGFHNRYSAEQACDLLLNQASIYGAAKHLTRMSDSQGQYEITENIVKSLERAVLSAAELYYELQIKP